MNDYKLYFDVLSSLASFVAIATVLISLLNSRRKPLAIKRVVIHKGKTESTSILIINNRKNYPVEIKEINCYINKLYNIEKKNNQESQFHELLSLSDNVFLCKEKFEISAKGNTDIKIKANNISIIPSKLLFSIHTSHGYHEIWCKKISNYNVGTTEVFGLEYRHEYNSKHKALIKYYWLKTIELFKKKS